MRKAIWSIVIMSLLWASLIGIAGAEGVTEVNIPGSMGNLYGVLKMPQAETPVPLIILSHGFGGSHHWNQDYADAFTKEGYATFNFDFCGGGQGSQSDGSMLEMSVLTEAEDLIAVIEHFRQDGRFDRIILWGESQGGFVSAYAAGTQPEDVDALVLFYPAFVLQDDSREQGGENGVFPETYFIMGTTVGRKYGEDAISFDIYDVIANYEKPTLILHGDRDGIVPLRYSERAAETMPNAELIVLPGQNHGFYGSARTQAAEEVVTWLNDLWR